MISPATLVLVGALVGAFGLGHLVASSSGDVKLAALREQMSRSQAVQAEHASRQLQDAQSRSDRLTAELHAARQAATTTQEKLNVALRRATTGRTCLDQPALRLLDGAHNLRVDLPPTGRGTAAADAGVATDTDIGIWIARAGQQYDECRRRLDALIGWHGGAPQ